MHNAVFTSLGMDAQYGALDVVASDFPRILEELRTSDYVGLSVTMPHKEMVMTALDRIDDDARLVRAANTVVREADGSLVGYNTDGVDRKSTRLNSSH